MKTQLYTAVLLVLGLVTVGAVKLYRQEDGQQEKLICWAYDQNSGELRIHTDEEMDHPSFTSQVYCQRITQLGWENFSTEDLKVNARNALEIAKTLNDTNALEIAKAIDAKKSNNFTAAIKRSGLDLHEL